jgi:hypothetical protein
VAVLGTLATGSTGSSVQWGDVATWVTAGVAFLALIAAYFAYRKQAQGTAMTVAGTSTRLACAPA